MSGTIENVPLIKKRRSERIRLSTTSTRERTLSDDMTDHDEVDSEVFTEKIESDSKETLLDNDED